MTDPTVVSSSEPTGPAPDDPLRAIERDAAAIDAELAGEISTGQPQQQAIREAIPEALIEENRAIFDAIIGLLSPAMPFLEKAYPPEVITSIARAYTAVEVKRGWNLSGLLSAEGALAIVALPPTVTAVTLGVAHFREKRIEREREKVATERNRHEWTPPFQSTTTGAPSS